MPLKSFAGGAVFGSFYGQSPPSVLALHGWGRTHRDFDEVLEGFDAVSIDLPGFGASPEPSGVWGAAEYAEAILGAVNGFEEPPLVVGHSFGGRVAVALAAQYPERVRSLLLIGVPLLLPADRAPARPAPAYRWLRWAHGHGLVPEARMEAARQKYGSADYRAAQGTMRQVLVKVVNETYEDELDRLTVPVRLLWGSGDTAAPVSVAREVQRRLSARGAEATLDVIEGVGHHVMQEAPDRVRTCLVDLLGSEI